MIKEIYENGNISYIFWTYIYTYIYILDIYIFHIYFGYITSCLSKGVEHVDFDLVSEEGF